jgi:hypothetical protein
MTAALTFASLRLSPLDAANVAWYCLEAPVTSGSNRAAQRSWGQGEDGRDLRSRYSAPMERRLTERNSVLDLGGGS